MGKTDENVEGSNEKYPKAPTLSPAFNPDAKISKNSFKEQFPESHYPEENRTVAIPNDFSGDFQELEERVKSMMKKSENNLSYRNNTKADICKVCGKEGQSGSIKDHIEANHLEEIILPCNLCDKTFRCRSALRNHNRQKCLSL